MQVRVQATKEHDPHQEMSECLPRTETRLRDEGRWICRLRWLDLIAPVPNKILTINSFRILVLIR